MQHKIAQSKQYCNVEIIHSLLLTLFIVETQHEMRT